MPDLVGRGHWQFQIGYQKGLHWPLWWYQTWMDQMNVSQPHNPFLRQGLLGALCQRNFYLTRSQVSGRRKSLSCFCSGRGILEEVETSSKLFCWLVLDTLIRPSINMYKIPFTLAVWMALGQLNIKICSPKLQLPLSLRRFIIIYIRSPWSQPFSARRSALLL